jgi:transposase-like protein
MADKVSLQVACVHGVSTRAVDDLVKAMGAGGMSKSQSAASAARSTSG